MTREEAIIYGTEWLRDEYLDTRDRAFIEESIKALEQENVLDKIRAEIEVKLAEPQYQHEGEDWQNGLIMAEIIIDKYKAESEDEK